jgi:hypothetical protein
VGFLRLSAMRRAGEGRHGLAGVHYPDPFCQRTGEVMGPADRDCEFVAHALSECTWLGKREVMGIRGDAAAHKAGLPKHEPAVLLIAQPNRFAQRMDYVAAGLFLGPFRTFGAPTHIRPVDG